jgi:hypothetical protein
VIGRQVTGNSNHWLSLLVLPSHKKPNFRDRTDKPFHRVSVVFKGGTLDIEIPPSAKAHPAAAAARIEVDM